MLLNVRTVKTAAAAAAGKSLERRLLGPHPRPPVLETGGLDQQALQVVLKREKNLKKQ